MLMNLSEATDVVKGMLHSYCLRTNVDPGDICEQRAHFFMICAQKCAQNFECVHETCPVLFDFFPYWDEVGSSLLPLMKSLILTG